MGSSSSGGSTINNIWHKVAQKLFPKSYAELISQLNKSDAINEREIRLAPVLEDHAKNYKSANSNDAKMISAAMTGRFHKMTGIINRANGSADWSSDPEDVYRDLLRSNGPQDHSHGISSLAYAFAAILALTLHHENFIQSDLKNNTPYINLSPLYGTNKTEIDRIRRKDGRGMLFPDTFAEQRTDVLPDSALVLLVLWNRYHNYVANQLLSYNEGNKWYEPDPSLPPERYLRQDDEIFDLARTLTCIHFTNVVMEDFLKGLIGMPTAGPSAKLDILHDIRGTSRDKASYVPTMESNLLYSFSSFAPPSFKSETIQAKDPDVRFRSIGNLHRNNGHFEDNDLAELLFNAIETAAGSPDGRVPDWAHKQEILKLKRAREANVCTLNEFRQHLGLKPFEKFEDWNKELAGAASKLYSHDIDKLELYPGLICERSSGSGFGFGYTMTWGLIADIVSRVRSDPIITSGFKESILTKWGFKDGSSCTDDVDDPTLNFNNHNGCFGAMLPKLLQRTLPQNCAYDNIYCLFPFIVPKESRQQIMKLPLRVQKKYNFDKPKQIRIKVLRTEGAISKVLNKPEDFPTRYKQNLMDLTGGYGHMLAFDDPNLHDCDLMVLLSSLIPDKGALRRIGISFAQRAQENLESRSILGKEGDASVNIVRDVIDATCIRWVLETIFKLELEDSHAQKTSKSDAGSKEAWPKSRKIEEKEREKFAAYFAYIFRNTESEFAWNVRERALAASKDLSDHIKQLIDKDKSTNMFQPGYRRRLSEWCLGLPRVGDQYSNGKKVPQYPAFTFLDRLVEACNIRPLNYVEGHLGVLRKNVEAEVQKNNSAITKHEVEEHAKQKLQEQRVIANIIGLAVVISVHFSKVCTQVVDFYLDDKYAEERAMLVNLCKGKNTSSSNKEIMEYVREAQRIKHHFGLWRDANLEDSMEFNQGDATVNIEKGDVVFLDFTSAHRDVAMPEKVILDREVNSLLGLGFHMCPAGSFVDQTISQMIRVIFRLEGLKRSTEKGHLKCTTLHYHPAPWQPEVFLDEDGGFSYYPKEMVLEFKASSLKAQKPRRDLQERKNSRKDSVDDRKKKDKRKNWNKIEKRYDDWNGIMDRGFSILFFVLWWLFVLHLLTPFSLRNLFFAPPSSPGKIDAEWSHRGNIQSRL